MSALAIGVPLSGNAKIGRVATTYTGTQSCPSTCKLRGNGCYYETGFRTRAINDRLNASKADALTIAKAEAAAIDGMLKNGPKGRAMRLHTGGDCRTTAATRLVSAASRRWTERGGGRVWTYTHAWRTVPKAAWSGVSVLASVETYADAAAALAAGFAPAIVVSRFPNGRKAWRIAMGDRRAQGLTIIPCPAQTGTQSCEDCRLCWNADALHARKTAIGFEGHGVQAAAIKRRLNVVA